MVSGKPVRILLADDHRLVRQGLRQLLSLEPDLEVVGEAADGDETVARVRELQPDLVLLDISMRGMPAPEAVRSIRKTSPGVKVVVLTMHAGKEMVLEMLKAGAVGYVLKDVEASELAHAIRSAWLGQATLPQRAALRIATEAGQPEGGSSWRQLTPREREVLQLVAEGLRNREIGARLFISEKTVRNHLSSVFRKLGVEDRTQAAILTVRRGLEQGRYNGGG
ncbi:MAG: response regulator transcription factor [bacterium]|nr:response regulator transcription factor [bacterium]